MAPFELSAFDSGQSHHQSISMSLDFHQITEHIERRSSRRLAFRSLAYCDAWPLFQATRFERFNEHLTWARPSTEHDAEARVDAIRGAVERGQLTALSVVLRRTGEWVSLFRLQPSGQGPGSLEVGVWTHPNFWHGRYSPELMTFGIDAAFELPFVDEIVGAGALENRGSLALMRVAGMVPVREFAKPTETGATIAALEFRLTREAWEAGRHPSAARARPAARAAGALLEAA